MPNTSITPAQSNFNPIPDEGFNPLAKQGYAQVIYMNPVDFKEGSKFVLEKFKPEYKLMTNIINYNSAPTQSEKELKLADVEFLYVMMNSVVIDDSI